MVKLKRFVKVIKGEYRGSTGTILKISKGKYLVRLNNRMSPVLIEKDAVEPISVRQESVEIEKTPSGSKSIPSRKEIKQYFLPFLNIPPQSIPKIVKPGKIKKFIIVTKGEYKGYTGIVINVSKGQLMVRLDANNRIIYIPKEDTEPLLGQKSEGINSKSYSSRNLSSSLKSTKTFSSVVNSGKSSNRIVSNEFRKGNYFENLEEKLKKIQNPFLYDTSQFMQLTDLQESFSEENVARDISEIVSKSSLSNKQINIKLFIIAYFFVQLNKRNMQLPYKASFRDIVAPNDDYNYILNASIKTKFLPKTQADVGVLKEYIKIILKYLNFEIIKAVSRAEVLDKIRERRMNIKFPEIFVPNLGTMKIIKERSSFAQKKAIEIRNNIIQGYINDINNGKMTIPANMDKNAIVEKLKELMGKTMLRTPSPSKKDSNDYINTLFNTIKLKERELYNEIKFPDVAAPIKERIINKISDLVISRVNNQMFDEKSANIITNYVKNIDKPDYYRQLTSSEKGIVEPYRRYYKLLVENNTKVLPGRLDRRKDTIPPDNLVKQKIREKIINHEKGRIRKFITKYPNYAYFLEILVNDYQNKVVDLKLVEVLEINIDKDSGLYTDDEMMMKLAQKELYSRLYETISKNFLNLSFYNVKSMSKFAR